MRRLFVAVNAYAAPVQEGATTAVVDVDDLIDATKPSTLAIAAAGAVGATGVLLGFTALQLWANVIMLGAYRAIPFAMVIVGAVLIFVGAKIYRLRGWAASAGAGLCFAAVVATALWMVLSFASGLFTLYALMLPPVGMAAAVLSFLMRPSAQAATDARARLARENLLTDY